jgi:hypothetical protein
LNLSVDDQLQMNSEPFEGDTSTSYALKKFKEAESTAQNYIKNQLGEDVENKYEIIIIPKIETFSVLIVTISQKLAKIFSFGE